MHKIQYRQKEQMVNYKLGNSHVISTAIVFWDTSHVWAILFLNADTSTPEFYSS